MCLQNRDCVRLGAPAEGDAVQVRWTDGLIYGAKFVASHSIPMYLVNLPLSVSVCVSAGLVMHLKRLTNFLFGPHRKMFLFLNVKRRAVCVVKSKNVRHYSSVSSSESLLSSLRFYAVSPLIILWSV